MPGAGFHVVQVRRLNTHLDTQDVPTGTAVPASFWCAKAAFGRDSLPQAEGNPQPEREEWPIRRAW